MERMATTHEDGGSAIELTGLTDQPTFVAWGMGGLVPMLAASLGYLAAGILAFGLGLGQPNAAARSAATSKSG